MTQRSGLHVVRRRQRDGSYKEYVYERKRNLPKRTDVEPYQLPEPGTVQHLINAYKHSAEWKALKPKSQLRYALYLRVWESEKLAKYPVIEITRRQVLSLRTLIAKNRGVVSGNSFVSVTSTWFKWLLQYNWVEHSPTLHIKALPGMGELKAWTEEQFQYAVERFAEPLRRAIILARYTGQRRGDVIKLRWSAYKDGVLTITQEKTRSGQEPITLRIMAHPVLANELDKWKQDATSVFILTTELGRPWAGDYLSWMVGDAVVKAGLPPGLNIHGLRKLCATTLAELGFSAHQIMQITGHRTLSMVQKYTKSVMQENVAKDVVEQWARSENKLLQFTTKPRIYKPGNSE